MITKETSTRTLLITAIIMIVLQGANLIGVAVNRVDIINNAEKLQVVYKDYVPMWFMEGLQKNNDYRTEEIIATLKGDVDEIKKINQKYIDFQKTMINNLIIMRGGMTTTVRSINIDEGK